MSQRGFGGGPMMAMRSEAKKAKDLKATLRTLNRYLKPQRFLLSLAMAASMLATLSSLFVPRLLGQITSNLVDLLQGKVQNLDFLLPILAWMALFYVLSSSLTYLQGFIMAKVTQDLTYVLRKDIATKINRIPLKYYDTQAIGDILSRVTNDVDAIGQSLQQAITQIVTALTTLVGIVFILLTIDLPLTLITLISLPLTLGFISRIVKMGQRYFRARSITLGQLNAHVEETLSAHAIIKAYNAENHRIDAFDALSAKLRMESLKSEFIGGLMMPVLNFISNLSFIAISAFGAISVIQGRLRVGDIQAFIQYNRAFTQPINQIANIGTLFQQTMASAERVFEFIQETEEPLQVDRPLPKQAFKGQVEFKQVSFGYRPDAVFIRNLSFKVEPGQKVAIVGPTGAGKTTLINLLMRFYEPLSGSIEIDGIDIASLSKPQLRSILGMVLQDTWLFHGTLEDNIRFNHVEASAKRFKDATAKARVDAFVKTLPDTYQYVLNEEASNLSSGQKQLLTIARAFMTSPIIQILDEATSSVDTRTEVLIQHAMETLLHQKTSFVIAHRLSTIKDADLILVIDKGSIVEQGSHLELIAKQGFYHQLYQSQFEPETSD